MAKAPKIEQRDPEEVYAEFLAKREQDIAESGEDFTAAPAARSDEFLSADFIEARDRADGGEHGEGSELTPAE